VLLLWVFARCAARAQRNPAAPPPRSLPVIPFGTEDFTGGPARASLSPPAHEDRRRPRVLVRAEAARPLHVAGGQQARLAQRRESDLGGEADLFTGERGKCDETPFTQAAILPAREADQLVEGRAQLGPAVVGEGAWRTNAVDVMAAWHRLQGGVGWRAGKDPQPACSQRTRL